LFLEIDPGLFRSPSFDPKGGRAHEMVNCDQVKNQPKALLFGYADSCRLKNKVLELNLP